MTSCQAPFGPPLNPTPPSKLPDCGVEGIVNDEVTIATGNQKYFKEMLLNAKKRMASMKIEGWTITKKVIVGSMMS